MKRILQALTLSVVLLTGANAPAAPDETGWTVYSSSGFSIRHPPGWQARSDKKSGRIRLDGPAGEQVYVWPVFIPAGTGGRQGGMTGALGAATVRKLAAVALPDMTWRGPETIDASTVRMYGEAKQGKAVALFSWVTSPQGIPAYFYAASAAAERYPRLEEDFARMFGSARIAGAAVSATPPPRPKFVQWRDPRENAFSLDAPEGWKIEGGMFRYAAVDTRAAFEAVSPDGKTRITSGDAEIPTFAIPNPMLAYAGLGEGSWYSPGYGVNMMVMNVVPPASFVRDYVTRSTARDCDGLKFIEERERPDAVRELNAVYAQYGLPVTIHAGEAAFTCQRNGRMMHGYYFAALQVVQQMGNGLWNVEKLFGYMTPAGTDGWAQDVMNTMLKSFTLDSRWASMQQHLVANVSGIVSRTQEVIANMTDDAYWSRQASLDELDRRRENAILGTVDVVDPATGREMKVEDSADYVWIDPRGNIVGTQTDSRPDLDFRQLIRLP